MPPGGAILVVENAFEVAKLKFCFIEKSLNFLLYHMQKNFAYLYPSGELTEQKRPIKIQHFWSIEFFSNLLYFSKNKFARNFFWLDPISDLIHVAILDGTGVVYRK